MGSPSFPFRNPVAGDGDPPEWTPPSYAKESEEEWKPPEYASAIKEEKKPSKFSNLINSLKPAERIHPGEGPKAKIDRFISDVLSADKHPEAKRLLTSQNPSEESLLPTTHEAGIKEPSTWMGGFAKGLYDEFVRPLASPVGAAMGLAFGKSGPLHGEIPKASEELPIRQNREIPPKIEDTSQIESKPEELPIKQPRETLQPSDIPPEANKQMVNQTINEGKAAGVPDNPIAQKLEEERQAIEKKDFVNPFEKSKNEEPSKSTIPEFDSVWKAPEYAQPIGEVKDSETNLSDIPDLSGQTLMTGERVRDLMGVEPKEAIQHGWIEKDDSQGFTGYRNIQNKKPTAEYAFDWPEAGGKKYTIKGGELNNSTVGEKELRELGIEIPETSLATKGQNFANEVSKFNKVLIPDVVSEGAPPIRQKTGNFWIDDSNRMKDEELAERSDPRPEAAARRATEQAKIDKWNETQENLRVTNELEKRIPRKERDAMSDEDWKIMHDKVKEEMRQTPQIINGVPSDARTGKPIKSSTNDITEMHGGLGGIKPSSRVLEPNKGPYGAALDKLFNSMGNIKEARVKQDIINKSERASRFAKFGSIKEEGVLGASKQLSTLKGEFDKVDLDKLKMTQPQVDSLFTAVKRAKITEGEKARGYTALFKLFNGEGVPQRNELKILDDVFGNGFADKITEMHGGLGSVGLNISKIANTMKSMQNAISLAAPLRHGIGLVARKEFYPAFTDMFKFFGNKEYYNNAMQAIEDRPNHMLGREAGLFLSKPNSLMSSEEEFLNSYVGDIPGVRTAVGASQRAYTGFLNKLRADTFDSMIKQMKGLGYKEATQVGSQLVPTKETEAIARYINNATGRGSLGSLNKMTNELNLLLWSPRMISSRINMLANPKIYTDLPKGMRLDGLKSLLGIAALGTTIDTLSAYAGAKVSSNILSTDYGKSRFGTSLIDPWGGFQQYIVAAARFLAGKTDSSQPTNRAEIAGRFLANKESPAVSLAHELLTAKFTGKSDDPLTAGNMTTQYGQKTNIYSEIGKRFLPIFLQDIMDLYKTNPDWSENIGLNSALGLASLAGMSQSYPEKKQKGQLKLSNSNKLSLR